MALAGITKWSVRALSIFALGCFAPGCTSTRGAATPTHDHWLPGYVLGIWGTSELDVRDDCPNTGAKSVRVGATWTTLAVTVITLGMYTPREVHVQCRATP